MSSKPVLKTGNRFIQTGNGIIYPTSAPLLVWASKIFASIPPWGGGHRVLDNVHNYEVFLWLPLAGKVFYKLKTSSPLLAAACIHLLVSDPIKLSNYLHR